MSHDEGEEEQRRLSIRWETKHHWPELRKEFGVSKTGAAMILSLVTADGHWLRYSRNKEFYALPRRYRNPLFTYRRVTGAADYLAAQGLIYHSKSEPGQRGWQSSMMATPELVTRTTQIIEAGPPLVLAKPPEVIILRGADRMAIDYAETRFTRKVRDEMEKINDSISSIQMEGCANASLRRIFNVNFTRGGRMYADGGAWQTMPKLDRLKIRIANEPVVEVDYSTLHPALLYAEVGKYAPADTYLIDGWPRKLTKVALNTLINAPNIHSARLAIANSEPIEEIAQPGSQEAIRAASKLILAIKKVHRPIAQFFHSGKGLELQRRDSDMAVKVMLLLRMAKIDVLPIHDSFLVPASKADALEEMMWEVACDIGLDAFNKKIRANLETHSASSATREENEIRNRIQTTHTVKRLETNTLAEKELMSPGQLVSRDPTQ